jgi:hypothetical protein
MDWRTLMGAGNLLLDMKQSHDLHQAQQQLTQMQAATLQEALRKQYLELLRNFVFGSLKQIEFLEQHLSNVPQPVYVAAKAVEWNLQDIGVSPAVFPDFADKEYVQQVQTRIGKIIQDSRSKLSSGQITEAEDCFNSIAQMPLLDQAIEGQTATEQLQTTEAEWKELSSKRSSATTKGIVTLLVSLFVCPGVGFVASLMLTAILGKANESLAGLGCMSGMGLAFIAPVIGLVVGIVFLASRSPARYKELEVQRREQTSKVPAREVWDKIENLFGKQSSEGYQNIRAQRVTQVMAILNQIQGYNELLSAPMGG